MEKELAMTKVPGKAKRRRVQCVCKERRPD